MKEEKKVPETHYKVLVKGHCVEYTHRFKDAEDAYKFSGDVNKQIFQVQSDGSAKLIRNELG